MTHEDASQKRDRLNSLSRKIIGVCISIHRELGPGLLESAYQRCIKFELTAAGLQFEEQQMVPIVYKGLHLDCGYRLDFVVEHSLILEIKAIAELLPVHEAQLMTYLKLKNLSLGLLINFNVPILRDGIKRLVGTDLFIT